MAKPQADAESVAAELRKLPKIDRLVAHEQLAAARQRLGGTVLTRMAREVVRELRGAVQSGASAPSMDDAARQVEVVADAALSRRLTRVINGSGVVVHTNLGRSPLSAQAVQSLADTVGRYVSLELDVPTGRRGPRGAFAEMALSQLTGAEDALVVNNNAAAVLLALTALAKGRGVVVSRGEQVEIGGGFRIPDVLLRSGARMIEVGTTNRTRLADYERVLQEQDDVAVVLRIHPGNFRQTGFVERPALEELAALAHRHGAWLVKDLGGGALQDLTPFGLPGEPVAERCVRAGADLVCFSCDKVLGGPQGGALVGRADPVDRARRDPLARALRLGRLPFAALEATLSAYLEGAVERVPVQRMLRTPLEEVRVRVEGWCRVLADRGIEAHVQEVAAAAGGGALADRPLPSAAAVV
ncbi:MAG: L-seryl-tRNA(Sec) selenium transferase, partial [Deltaproteobacteria bacterium]|nr:L-seryl-tRNA(Sec) selenium transferase [Deltaproteobacteria bacterium]MBW2531659.1 L-seryl-tRNA(Sec) selenium transferase [Deltaproteobacteria bacterium]